MLQVPPLARERAACCYLCDLTDTPGRFHPEKAEALGVPKGPMFGRLKGGQAVELPNGKTIQPADVCWFAILLPELTALSFSSCCTYMEQEKQTVGAGKNAMPLSYF